MKNSKFSGLNFDSLEKLSKDEQKKVVGGYGGGGGGGGGGGTLQCWDYVGNRPIACVNSDGWGCTCPSYAGGIQACG